MMRFFSAGKSSIGKLAAVGLATGIAALISGTPISAQPTGGNIMTDVSLTSAGACATARVRFSVPIRYVNHFPQDRGNEVRIQLKPLPINALDAQALLEREAYSPVNDGTPLDNVIYEGDMGGGPYLSLQFDGSVHFSVAQGTDFRSINISFGADAASCPAATRP